MCTTRMQNNNAKLRVCFFRNTDALPKSKTNVAFDFIGFIAFFDFIAFKITCRRLTGDIPAITLAIATYKNQDLKLKGSDA